MKDQDVFQRSRLLKAHAWAKLWVSHAKMQGHACCKGDDVVSWDWWLSEIIKVPKEISTKYVANAAQCSKYGDPGSELPGFTVEMECLWHDPMWAIESKEHALKVRWRELHEKYGMELGEYWEEKEGVTL